MTEETGPDRIRRAIELARGGQAPEFPILVCGPGCRSELPESINVTQEVGIGGGQVERGLDWSWLVCSACFRLKFSPIHWFMRAAGVCDGRNTW